jgi:hypothetical protein
MIKLTMPATTTNQNMRLLAFRAWTDATSCMMGWNAVSSSQSIGRSGDRGERTYSKHNGRMDRDQVPANFVLLLFPHLPRS